MSTFITRDSSTSSRGPGRKNRHRRAQEALGLTPELMSLAHQTRNDMIRGEDAHFSYLLAWARANPHALVDTDDEGNYLGTYEPEQWAGLHAQSFRTARKYFREEDKPAPSPWTPACVYYARPRRSRRAIRADHG